MLEVGILVFKNPFFLLFLFFEIATLRFTSEIIFLFLDSFIFLYSYVFEL